MVVIIGIKLAEAFRVPTTVDSSHRDATNDVYFGKPVTLGEVIDAARTVLTSNRKPSPDLYYFGRDLFSDKAHKRIFYRFHTQQLCVESTANLITINQYQ